MTAKSKLFCQRFPVKLSALFFLAILTSKVSAMTANPQPFVDQQPDGAEVTLRIKGDEHFNWIEDLEGYTVKQTDGWYNYARLNNRGRLVATQHRVGQVHPSDVGLTKGILPHASERAKSALNIPHTADGDDTGSSASSAPQAVAPSGNIKNLVVMVRFSDHTGRTLPSTADMDVLFNSVGGHPSLAPTGSVRDVYLENSYGQMTLDSDISGWITVSNTESYYANSNSGLTSRTWEALIDALNTLDQTVDFNQYDTDNDGYIDSITFIHSGYGAEWGGTDSYGASSSNRIWSHRWAIQPAWVSNEGVRVEWHLLKLFWVSIYSYFLSRYFTCFS